MFTPALKDGRKRPVLFWIHGGGYTNGNGIEHDGYNGENLARAGDIVFCSINHRLGPLGYCNLASIGGEKYAASGNVGSSTSSPRSSGFVTTSPTSAATPAT